MKFQVLLEKVETHKLFYILENFLVDNLKNFKYQRKKMLIVLGMFLKCCKCRIVFNKSATVSVYNDVLIKNGLKYIN